MVRTVTFFGMILLSPNAPAVGQFPGDILGSPAPRLPRGFFQKSVQLENEPERKYAIFVPPQYLMEDTKKWPMLVFLHGSGENGTDGVRQTTVGLPLYIAGRPKRFPFITVFPQAHNMWFRGKEEAAVWAIMDAVRKEYRVDPDRIYLTGLSMGGFATWEMAIQRPDVFAAIVPVCGVGPREYMGNLINLPVWAFHGALDKNVPVAGSRDAIAELKKLGAHPEYREYPDLEHNSWDRAYATPELWRWLLQQKRKPPPRVIDYTMPGGAIQVWWLAVEAEPNLKSPAHIHAEIGEGGKINIESEGVAAWGLNSDREPLKPGDEIQITWNGAIVFRGPFKGGMTIKPQAGGPVAPEVRLPLGPGPTSQDASP